MKRKLFRPMKDNTHLYMIILLLNEVVYVSTDKPFLGASPGFSLDLKSSNEGICSADGRNVLKMHIIIKAELIVSFQLALGDTTPMTLLSTIIYLIGLNFAILKHRRLRYKNSQIELIENEEEPINWCTIRMFPRPIKGVSKVVKLTLKRLFTGLDPTDQRDASSTY